MYSKRKCIERIKNQYYDARIFFSLSMDSKKYLFFKKILKKLIQSYKV